MILVLKVSLSLIAVPATHLCGDLRLLNPLTNPNVHMLCSSWELIQAGHPVLELNQRGRRKVPKDEKMVNIWVQN